MSCTAKLSLGADYSVSTLARVRRDESGSHQRARIPCSAGGGEGVDEAFLSAIRTQPTDTTSRLVYADWLDERDDPRGEYLRLLCAATGWAKAAENRERIVARLQELRAEFDPEWLAVVQHGVG